MSEKNRDNKKRWRSITVGFRVSPQESDTINMMVLTSGLTKQDYCTKRLLCEDIVVHPNIRVQKYLRDYLVSLTEELKRLEKIDQSTDVLSNGVITTSLRGITNTDFVHLPNTSLVDLRRVIPEGQQVKSFLVDTATDKIKGIRIVELSDKTISQLLKDWITMENSGISSSEIFETLQEKVYCYSSDVFMKRSTYVGRDVSSMVPRGLFISPPIE